MDMDELPQTGERQDDITILILLIRSPEEIGNLPDEVCFVLKVGHSASFGFSFGGGTIDELPSQRG
jgi:hypothetical protein